ncbi:O(6)-methylguanine-induced apoptosis 2 [Erpetoichthys calabaricus]|uniref:O(6)-methylguanine-induced apoptosis 2 n=1 Tax=Erpetoichthys calabaricus TaxID=27687 RepID=UPI0022342ED1|nr:O(6)-methylguanine-induced apoptosis 2 [Erpetoichthys calabaricus]
MAVNVAGDKNDNYSYKRIHSLVTGKLCKGYRVSSNACSIPTKYRTVIVPDTERKGFSSQTKRFLYESNQNENPGPGSYYVVDSPAETGSPSLSKKGTSSFVSKSIRAASRRFRVTPAANAYSPTLLTKRNFSVGNSSVFQQPIAVKPDTVKDSTPAPNQYNVSSSALGSSSNASAQSAFMSKTQRNLQLSGNLKVPSPCHYRVNDSLTKESSKTVVSSFRSTTTRKFLEDTSQVPGPAAYNPFDPPKPVQNSTLQKRHYLCISAPAMKMPKTPPLPGPGQYEMVDYNGPPKHYMSSAVFVSNTSRWAGDNKCKEFPGPGFYEPEKPKKHSFLYNNNKKWVPN